MKKLMCMLTACAVSMAILPINAAAYSDDSDPQIIVMFTGEYNGNFVDGDNVIGMDIVKSVINEQKNHADAVFTLDCGDTFQGNFFSNSNKGEAAVEIMNAVGYDAITLGNHEFDFGYEKLLSLAEKADFPFLTQPSVYSENDPLSHMEIIERNGYKLGVFGLTTPATKQISYAFDKDFGNPSMLIEYAKKATSYLRENGADIVICLSHIGVADNLAHDFGSAIDIAENVLGIDVIIDGQSMGFFDFLGIHTPIICTNGSASLGMLKFYKNGNSYEMSSDFFLKEDLITYKSDDNVGAIIKKWQLYADELGESVIGYNNSEKLIYDKNDIRLKEAVIGNAVADAIRTTAESEIAFLNAGCIRSPLGKGDVTWSDLNNMLPYSNYVLYGTIKGSVVREAIEHSLVLRETENGGGFLQVSGLSFTFNPNMPDLKKLISISINGAPLEDERVYTIAVPNYIAEGGDGYTMMVGAVEDAVSKGDLTEIFANYIKEHGETLNVNIDGRIIISNESVPVVSKSTVPFIITGCAAVVIVIAVILIKNKTLADCETSTKNDIKHKRLTEKSQKREVN